MSARDLDERNITDAVVRRVRRAKTARLKTVMASLVRHLHEFAREVRLTEAEWAYGIDYLTRTGQKCTDKRQEFILLSDTLGLSTLVTQLNHRSRDGETEQTVFGPFHRENAPRLGNWANISSGVKGRPCFVIITVKSPQGKPVTSATVDVWHSDDEGFYDVQHHEWDDAMRLRGVFAPDKDGAVRFRTIVPRYYPVPTDGPVGELLKASARRPMRPGHMHFMITAPGYDRLVTHIFAKGDRYLDSDPVFGVRNSLVREYVHHQPGIAPDGTRMTMPFYTMTYDFVLRPLKGQRKPLS
jgi:hydroxyquinol 1,2-dioxygenase